MNRLSKLPTLRINSAQKISLNYDGKTCRGVTGDMVATALYASGIRIFSRSLKYHRPRGLYSLDGECSNTCMQVNGIPNVRTENTLLNNGMTVKAQNVKGTPEKDLLGFMDRLDCLRLWLQVSAGCASSCWNRAPGWAGFLTIVRLNMTTASTCLKEPGN